MAYANVPRIFSTDPGTAPAVDARESDGTSRYYIYVLGLIRVKFKSGHILVEPGKNICYLRDRTTDRVAPKGLFLDIDGTLVPFSTVMKDPHYQGAYAGAATVDFVLDAHGEYLRDFHHGHPVTNNFYATVRGRRVDVRRLDYSIQQQFGPLRDPLQWPRYEKLDIVDAYTNFT